MAPSSPCTCILVFTVSVGSVIVSAVHTDIHENTKPLSGVEVESAPEAFAGGSTRAGPAPLASVVPILQENAKLGDNQHSATLLEPFVTHAVYKRATSVSP